MSNKRGKDSKQVKKHVLFFKDKTKGCQIKLKFIPWHAPYQAVEVLHTEQSEHYQYWREKFRLQILAASVILTAAVHQPHYLDNNLFDN